MYLIEYLGRIMLEYGTFNTESNARKWINTWADANSKLNYTVVRVPVNHNNASFVVPFGTLRSYRNAR